MSIGATPRDLVLEVLSSSASLLFPALVTGILVSAIAPHLVRAAFVGVNVMNPTTYLVVGVVECALVLMASIGPAARAARIDPIAARRSD